MWVGLKKDLLVGFPSIAPKQRVYPQIVLRLTGFQLGFRHQEVESTFHASYMFVLFSQVLVSERLAPSL